MLSRLLAFRGHVVFVNFADDRGDILDLGMLHLNAMRRTFAELLGEFGRIKHAKHRFHFADLVGRSSNVQSV